MDHSIKLIIFLVLKLGLLSISYGHGSFDQDLYESVLDPVKCDEQLEFLYSHPLGLTFLDASASIPAGIQSGNINDLGDYYQCLRINEDINDMDIQGKYCSIIVPLDQQPIVMPETPIPWPPQPDNQTIESLNKFAQIQRYAHGIMGLGEPITNRIFPIGIVSQLGMTLAACVPKVCTATQAVNFVQDRVSFLNFTFTEYYCRLPNDKTFRTRDWVGIGIFSFIGLLVVISTTIDLYFTFVLKREADQLQRCFSIYTNTRRFLSFSSPPGALECVDGIRAISMMWIVVGHTFSMTMLAYIHNIFDTLSWFDDFTSVWINSAPITVDTFFLLSGLLAVYTTIGKITRKRFIRTIHLFYINRLLRMFPLLATVVLLQVSVFNHLSDGPFWQNVSRQVENCENYWWSTLLHVQNYVNTLEICHPHSWYLSVDTQLYIICPLVMVFLFGAHFYAWVALCGSVLLSLAASSVYSYLFNFSAALVHLNGLHRFNDYITKYYLNTLPRAAPFFIGMVYGYMLYTWKNKRIRLTKIHATLLWILAFAMMSFCIFSHYPIMQPNHDAQAFDNFLNAYMRALWAIGLGWLIFACVQGYGGPINWFLSLQLWKLPARLSYAMYLLHVPIMMIANGSFVKTYYFTNGANMYRYMSDISLTFLFAFVLCIVIDAPFSTLQKVLINGGGKKKPSVEKIESRRSTTNNNDDKYTKTTL